MTQMNGKNCKPVRTITASASGAQPKLLGPQRCLLAALDLGKLLYVNGKEGANFFPVQESVCCATGDQKVQAFPWAPGPACYHFTCGNTKAHVQTGTQRAGNERIPLSLASV